MSVSGMKIKLLLVDDHAIVRAGFRYLLESDTDYVIREVNTAEEACLIYSDYKPDAVIMDLLMPGMGGLQGVRHIYAKDNKAKVLVLSMRDDPIYVSQALKAGALGYVTKRSAHEDLTKAVSVIIRGQRYLSADVADKISQKSSKTDEEQISCLSDREFEIFCLLAAGRTVVNISNDLHLSPKTVSNHRTHIMHKLQATNIVEITRLAIRNGLIEA